MMKNSKNAQSFADKLEDRLIEFAVRIIRLVARLPRTPAGNKSLDRSFDLAHPRTKLWRSARSRKPCRPHS